MTHTTTLTSWPQAHAVLTRLAAWLKPRLAAGGVYTLSVGEQTRSAVQNARLHAMLTDVAKQIEWAGKKRSIDVWKRLMVAAWLRAENEHLEFLPAIDGRGVDVIFERTSRMNVAQVSSLIDYVRAWGDVSGVVWSDGDNG